MITVYPVDKKKVWTGEVLMQDERAPVTNKILTPPPKLSGTECAIWLGGKWRILPKYPTTPKSALVPPKTVTMRQARLALLQQGKLGQIEAAINGIEDIPTRTATLIEWEYASTVDRDHTWVMALASQLGWSEEDLDNLFLLAETF